MTQLIRYQARAVGFALLSFLTLSMGVSAADTVEKYIAQYPNQQQAKMMNAWLAKHQKGTFSFSGLVDPTDTTVVTPQATVDYGYNWFSVSNGPAIVVTPQYDKFFSVSVFDMKHNVPAVVVNPQRPLVIVRPGQAIPKGNYTVVELETDQGLVFTRMVVVDNMGEVRKLSESINMIGGDGDMNRSVEIFSPAVEKEALGAIQAALPGLNPDTAFGKKSGDVDPLALAGAVMMGQLGTPSDTVRYNLLVTDSNNVPFNGKDNYVLTVPAGIVHDDGYYSITIYATENKGLIPNDEGRYDRTTYSSTRNADGTYTVSINPMGEGLNGIPSGKYFYVLLRAYVPVKGADMTVAAVNKTTINKNQ
jgi:hypothetical protein